MSRLECVPNFSEGKDPARVGRIADAARTVPGVSVLDVEANPDHHRSVITLVGEEGPLVEAVLGMMRVATREIDLTQHRGEHPRIGATDVVPFVPLEGATMDDARRAAEALGARVATELAIPVYFYGAAARRPERTELPKVREGEFEGLREAIRHDPARAPDLGPARLHPTAGAVAIGARPVLIAYNAYLATGDVAIAKRIAKAIRGRDGGLAEVRALGFEIRERARAQVSMNLTDYRRTPIARALEAVRREAERFGTSIEESEIVGLVPEEALYDAAEYYLQLHRFDRRQILERRVRETSGPAETFAGFLERMSQRTPTPGGGSAAAAAAAMACALGEMVLAYSIDPKAPDPSLESLRAELRTGRSDFLRAVEEDARAYEAVRAARRTRKDHPDAPQASETVRRALEAAAEVPLASAERAERLRRRLAEVGPRTRPTLASDLATALTLFAAARDGAAANVRTNLEDLEREGAPVGAWRARLEATVPPAAP
ncbi:MAG: glutamate formimidoyltransferase [Thermoplasmata archaeon]